jgi:hypothetical protein
MPPGIIIQYAENNRGYTENETESGHFKLEYRVFVDWARREEEDCSWLDLFCSQRS